MEFYLKTNKNRLINTAILLSGLLFLFFALYNPFHFTCIFKKIFKISCPACGLTRGFISLLALDFKTALFYNILSFPLLLCGFIIFIFLLKDIISNKISVINFLFKVFEKFYIIIITLLIITMIINNIHNI